MKEGLVEESFLEATCFLPLITRSVTEATNIIDTDDTAHLKLLIGFKLLTVICVHIQTGGIGDKTYHKLRLVNYTFTPKSCYFTFQMQVILLFYISLRILPIIQGYS